MNEPPNPPSLHRLVMMDRSECVNKEEGGRYVSSSSSSVLGSGYSVTGSGHGNGGRLLYSFVNKQ